MEINYNSILKSFLSLLFITLSINFFYLGYTHIKNIKDVKHNKTVNIIKDDNKNSLNNKNNFNKLSSKSIISNKIKTTNRIEKKIIVTVKKNDTFSKLIEPYFSNQITKQQIIKLINKKIDLKKLNVGQKIILYSIDNKKEISKIVMPINYYTNIIVTKNSDSKFIINEEKLTIITELSSKKFTITKSIFEDGRKANLPLPILTNLIRLYSFDIDFQRDIQKGNKLEILYEIFLNENKKIVSYGEIKYINLSLQKNNIEYFLFKTSKDFTDYFNKEGKNFRKALMKTPLDGARLSSSFGKRKHPILGYNKMHKGTDFVAPTGTAVYAAGNGTLEYVGRNGSFGNYIRIRHNSSYKTVYAHLNGFHKGISKGVRVKQGQIIGYVGSSGRSTGPHLHYEVIFHNKPINPMTMNLPSGKVLKGEELKEFKKNSNEIYSNFLFHLYE